MPYSFGEFYKKNQKLFELLDLERGRPLVEAIWKLLCKLKDEQYQKERSLLEEKIEFLNQEKTEKERLSEELTLLQGRSMGLEEEFVKKNKEKLALEEHFQEEAQEWKKVRRELEGQIRELTLALEKHESLFKEIPSNK